MKCRSSRAARSTAASATPMSAGSVVGTNDSAGVVPDEAVMAVGRVKQNIWARIVGRGDRHRRRSAGPRAAAGSAASTSPTRPRAFAATRTSSSACGAWRPVATISGDDATAYGFKVDYPNDMWEFELTHKRIGRDFDPSLGFVPRRAVHLINGQINNRTRLSRGPIQQLIHEFEPSLATDLVREVGELSRLHRAGQLALPKRRPLRVQRQSDRRAAGRAVRSRRLA